MPFKAPSFFTSALTSAALILAPAAANAGEANHMETSSGNMANPGCGQSVSSGSPINITPLTINSNINVYKPVTINKNIDASRTVIIEKNISVDKSGPENGALAITIAAASANAIVNINGAPGSAAASVYFGGGPESPGPVTGGNLGALSVNTASLASAEQPVRCTFEDATVIKAIHAVCVAENGRQRRAANVLRETWIESSYEGEVARCRPGAHVKMTIGGVLQSSEGIAASWSRSQTLECGVEEAVHHDKDGALTCAAAAKLPPRRYGRGDLFFTHRTKVCQQTHQEYLGSAEPVSGVQQADNQITP